MARQRKRKNTGIGVEIRPETRAKVNKKLGRKLRSIKAKRAGIPADVLEKIRSNTSNIVERDKEVTPPKTAAQLAAERRAASSTSPGKGKPKTRGKPRGTGGGRMTRGS